MDIFEAFGRSTSPMTLTNLAQEIGIPLSTCHGITQTLLRRGYLYMLARRKEIYPTKRLWHLANRVMTFDPLHEVVRPVAEWLRDETSETIIVGKREGDTVKYLDVVDGPQAVRFTVLPGDIKPLHSTVIGKALLSTLDDEELAVTLERLELRRVTDRTITDPRELLREIVSSRKLGYFMTREENVSDAMGIGVPVAIGAETLAIAVAGPLPRMDARKATLVELLAKVAARVAAGRPA